MPESFYQILGFILTLAVNIGAIGYFWGKVSTKITSLEDAIELYRKDTKEDIERLELKQDRHNGLYEKVTRAEESAKAAHHRIDTLEMRQRY